MKRTTIILVGPMGAGKTAVGRQLAKALQWTFIDSDQEIERRTGVNISLIFEIEGEAGFRRREQNVIAELAERTETVLATGGGAVLAQANRKCLKTRGFVVYLHASLDAQLERTSRRNTRPLLATADPRARLEKLFAERDPLYREIADTIVPTDGRRVRAVTGEIRRVLKIGDTKG
jgi:shikimate kinase